MAQEGSELNTPFVNWAFPEGKVRSCLLPFQQSAFKLAVRKVQKLFCQKQLPQERHAARWQGSAGGWEPSPGRLLCWLGSQDTSGRHGRPPLLHHPLRGKAAAQECFLPHSVERRNKTALYTLGRTVGWLQMGRQKLQEESIAKRWAIHMFELNISAS